jgi:RNA polymerase sigma-70 factor (ECF subfamily)
VKVAEFERQRHGSFRAWLKAITRNKVGDVYKRLKKQARAEGGTEAHLRLEQQPELFDSEETGGEETGLIMQQALELAAEHFESRTIDAFVRVVIDGQSAQSVAEVLKMSLNTVYVSKSKILSFLRQELAGLID